jgi:bifunctional polynucleotide phosphatase/kinase
MEWKYEYENDKKVFIYGSYGKINDAEKIAGFDLDGTIITTQSGNKFPRDKDDWKFMYGNKKGNNDLSRTSKTVTVKKIQKFVDDGYRIIIFSNQGGLKNDSKLNAWKSKIDDIIKIIDIPIEIYGALGDSVYRKPFPTLWKLGTSNNKNEKSFFCGDMCGRKNDNGDTDLKFAINNKIKFYAPEEIFLDTQVEIPTLSLKKHSKLLMQYMSPEFNSEYKFVPRDKEMIIMCGIQGSGKSTYVDTQIKQHNYKILSYDKCKNKNKIMKELKSYLNNDESIVIDNTNPSDIHHFVYFSIWR